MIYQKEGTFEESVRILLKGLALFPADESLPICLAVSYMNMGKFKTALSHLLKFQHRQEAIQAIATCCRVLNKELPDP